MLYQDNNTIIWSLIAVNWSQTIKTAYQFVLLLFLVLSCLGYGQCPLDEDGFKTLDKFCIHVLEEKNIYQYKDSSLLSLLTIEK